MKKIFSLLVAATFAIGTRAQNTFPSTGSAGIGTTTPAASSILEVKSTTQGTLIPRMTKAQRDAIVSPAEGLLVYVTDKKPGIYYYESGWTAARGANTSLSNLASPTAVNVDLLPGTDNTINLGSSSLRWKDIYADGNYYIGVNKVMDVSGVGNTFIGEILNSTNTGTGNTFMGHQAGTSNTSGLGNTTSGYQSLFSNNEGSYNTVSGIQACYYNTSGESISAFGVDALYSNTTGNNNTAVGYFSLFSNTTANYNTAIGLYAGSNVVTGSSDIFIGSNADCGSAGTLSNSTVIGTNVTLTASNNFLFGNSDVVGWGFGVAAGSRAIKVGTSSSNGNGAYLTTGGVWTDISDRSKKENITELDKNSILEKILQLKISEWKYKGTENEYHIGPMAEDFHRLFEVGDDSSISSMDKTGVLFLGMQALNEENGRLKSEVEEMKSENGEQQEQIDELKSKVDQLESANGNSNSEITSGYTELKTLNSKPLSAGASAKVDEILLGQNIPNPFNNSTLIPFRIPKDCKDASIMIANTSTSEVMSVIPISCNEDHVSIDAGALASGTYSYMLYVDGKIIDTKSMILQK